MMRAASLLALAASASAKLDVNCSSDLVISYDIPYYNSVVDCGNLFIKADVAIAPTVKYAPANPKEMYTLVYISSCSHCTKSYPDNPEEGLVHLHYVAADIPAETLLGSGDVASAAQWITDDWPRHGPGPTQSYNFYLMQHDGPTPTSLRTSTCWPSVNNFCSQEDFTAVMAAQPWTIVAEQKLTGVYYNDTFRNADL